MNTEIQRRFPYAKLRVTSVNGRLMLSGSAPDGPTVDKAVVIVKQFGPEVINMVNVTSPQQVMLEVRFVEANRTAGRDLGVQWNVFGQHNNSNIGNRTPVGQLPVTPTGTSLFKQPGTDLGSAGPTLRAPASRSRRSRLPACSRAPRRSASSSRRWSWAAATST